MCMNVVLFLRDAAHTGRIFSEFPLDVLADRETEIFLSCTVAALLACFSLRLLQRFGCDQGPRDDPDPWLGDARPDVTTASQIQLKTKNLPKCSYCIVIK